MIPKEAGAKDMHGQPIRFAGARAVDRGGRLLWAGPMLPHQNGAFFLDGAAIESVDLSGALALLNSAPKATGTQP